MTKTAQMYFFSSIPFLAGEYLFYLFSGSGAAAVWPHIEFCRVFVPSTQLNGEKSTHALMPWE